MPGLNFVPEPCVSRLVIGCFHDGNGARVGRWRARRAGLLEIERVVSTANGARLLEGLDQESFLGLRRRSST